MPVRDDTILVGGYAQFPFGTTGNEVYKFLGIGLEVDPQSGEIVNVASTFLCQMTQDFLYHLLIGHNLNKGMEEPIAVFKRRYYGKGKKAIISAMMEAYGNYEFYLSEKIK